MSAAALGRFAAPALLLFGALVHWSPEFLADWLGGLVGAWETFGYAVEAAAVWLAVAVVSRAVWPDPEVWVRVRVVCLWLAGQHVMRGGCRPLFDMALPLRLDQPMCVKAFGEWVGWADIAATAAVVAVVAGAGVHRGR